MFRRTLAARLVDIAGKFPVITLTGPRQSGKITLCRNLFPDLPFVSLEKPAERAFVVSLVSVVVQIYD